MKIQRVILIIHKYANMQEKLQEAIELRYPELIGKEILDIDPKLVGYRSNDFMEYHIMIKYKE